MFLKAFVLGLILCLSNGAAKAEIFSKEVSLSLNNEDVNFVIHYDNNNLYYAERVAEILKNEGQNLLKYVNIAPLNDTHIIFDSRVEAANGAATVFPRNKMILNLQAPRSRSYLANSHDWFKVLVIHELMHILSLAPVSGFNKFLHYLFGSSSELLKMVVPRWYSEGIAIWAESKFTGEGRLNDPNLTQEFLNLFLNQNVCNEIACLDDPMDYPYRSYPYWFGAHFFHYIEARKPGAIGCMIRSHAYFLPFTLHSIFKECLGEDVTTVLEIFKETLEKNLKISSQKSKKLVNSQAGIHLTKKGPIYLEHTKEIPRIIYKLLGEKEKEVDFNGRVSSMQQFTFLTQKNPVAIEQIGLNGKRRVTFLDPETNEVLNEIQASGFSHFIDSDTTLLWVKGKDHSWSLKKEVDGSLKEIYKIHPRGTLKFSKLIESKRGFILYILYTPIAHKRSQFIEMKISPQLNQIHSAQILFESSDFTDAGTCLREQEVSFLFRMKDGTYGFLAREDQSWKMQYLQSNRTVISYLMGRGKGTLIQRANELDIQPVTCRNFLSKEFSSKSKKVLSPRKLKTPKNIESPSPQIADESYNSFAYLFPRYWFFNLNTGDNLDQYTILTHAEDPKNKQRLDLALVYYDEIRKTVPIGSYRYNFDDFYLTGFYFKGYGKTSSQSKLQINQSTGGGIGVVLNGFKGNGDLRLTYNRVHEEDFIGERDGKDIIFNSGFSFINSSAGNFFRSFSLNLRASYRDSDILEDYFGGEGRLNIGINFAPWWTFDAQATYGKLFSQSLLSGSLFGGGLDLGLFGNSRFHEFSSLGFTDLFGRYLSTLRAEKAIRIFRPYLGSGIIPLYLKELWLFGGGEYAHSEFIFYDKSLFRKTGLFGYFFGIRSRINFLYGPTSTVDLIFSTPTKESSQDESRILLTVKAPIEF